MEEASKQSRKVVYTTKNLKSAIGSINVLKRRVQLGLRKSTMHTSVLTKRHLVEVRTLSPKRSAPDRDKTEKKGLNIAILM